MRAPDRLPNGVTIGHAQDAQGLTGCTAIIFDKTVIAAADIRGSAPATSNFSALNPVHVFPRVDGIFLAGGSVFGLNAVGGMQRFLEEKGRGFNVGVTTIPIVPAAGIFDLAVGDPKSRPTAEMGYEACKNANGNLPEQGSVGAGTGASVGKFFGIKQAMRGGFGFSSGTTEAGSQMWVFAVVNAFGDIWQPHSGTIVAGARKSPDSNEFINAAEQIAKGWKRTGYGAATQVQQIGKTSEAGWTKQQGESEPPVDNTTLLVAVTTAKIDVLDARKLAESCMLGLSDAVNPACTIFDGDLAIAASIGEVRDDITGLCVIARRVAGEAIISAVTHAQSLPTIPSHKELNGP
jgi:L-aminopeptidase/D-esterase-like protein